MKFSDLNKENTRHSRKVNMPLHSLALTHCKGQLDVCQSSLMKCLMGSTIVYWSDDRCDPQVSRQMFKSSRPP